MNSISKETFDGMDTDSKLSVLFDYISDQHKTCKSCVESISKKHKVNKSIAALFGFVGGLAGYFGERLLR